MKRLLIIALTIGAMAAGATGPVSAKQPKVAPSPADNRTSDSYETPLSIKQAALRQTAQEMVLNGEATPKGKNKVVKIAPGQFVELARQGEDTIWTVLGEFSDFAHNSIAEPDRSVDNTTIWEPDFNQSYYEDLLFSEGPGVNSMRNYYIEQSSGKYAVNGDVTDWNPVPQTAAYYGSNAKSDAYAWLFIRDELTSWYNAKVSDGWTAQDFTDYLSQFDQWDRYDWDGDGNYNEPDGYIDHFQTIHSGEGEEAGGGALGSDAIWSHRWYAFYNYIGAIGPSPDYLLGGIEIGDTNFWIGDYTIEPENGGVGVFSHEFAHDLGLPDEYDTSGNAGGAENSTGFWTLMSSGSWGNNGDPDEGIGDRPFHMNAWDKFQLGWLKYGVSFPGDHLASVKLGPAEHRTKQTQGYFVVLPDREYEVNVGPAYSGSYYFYSGAADDLNTSMSKSFTLPGGAVSISAMARFNIESDYDYAYLMVNGTRITTNVSNSTVVPEGIEGTTGGSWVNLTADLSAYAGQTVDIGFGYWTDGGVQGNGGPGAPGFAVDDIAITGQALEDAEIDTGWTFDTNSDTGFSRTTGTDTFSVFNAYLAENRQYWGYDAGLQTGPYNFASGNWAERFPYQDGLVIWYWNSFYSDNSVGAHPGEGLILPVDARPDVLHWVDDGTNMRGRLQAYDASFGTPRDSITLNHNGVDTTIPAAPAVKVFNDMNSYYMASDPADGISHHQADWFSVDNPHTGTVIRVKSITQGGMMQIDVTAPH